MTAIVAVNRSSGAQGLTISRDGYRVRLKAEFDGGTVFHLAVNANLLGVLAGQTIIWPSEWPIIRCRRDGLWGGKDVIYVMKGSRVIVVETARFARATRVELYPVS